MSDFAGALHESLASGFALGPLAPIVVIDPPAPIVVVEPASRRRTLRAHSVSRFDSTNHDWRLRFVRDAVHYEDRIVHSEPRLESDDAAAGRVPYYLLPEDERRDPHEGRGVVTDCGEGFGVYGVCSDPFCVECSRKRSEELRDRLWPALETMRRAKMITLTIGGDVQSLESVYRELLASWRRMFEYSLGSRNLPRLMKRARHFVNLGWATGKIDDAKAKRYIEELGRFEARVAKAWRRAVRPVRFRDLVGYGWRIIETTRGAKGDRWHMHFHLCLDCFFIPMPALRALWEIATRGAGRDVHIQQITKDAGGLMEVSKYFAKPTLLDLSDELKNELRAVAYGMTRCEAFGVKFGVRYEIPAAPVEACPYCKSKACRRHPIGPFRTIQEKVLDDGARYVLVEFAGQEHWLLRRGGVLVSGAGVNPFVQAYMALAQQRIGAGAGAPLAATGPPGG